MICALREADLVRPYIDTVRAAGNHRPPPLAEVSGHLTGDVSAVSGGGP